MLDLKKIRDEGGATEALLKRKDPDISLAPLIELDKKMRENKVLSDELKNQRNILSKEIGTLKQQGKECADKLLEVGEISESVKSIDKELERIEKEVSEVWVRLPNVPDEEIPISHDPKDNVELTSYLEKPAPSFPQKNHLELNEKLKLFDFERGAKIAGSGFVTYRGMGARLEWALLNYMIDTHVKRGFEMWMLPLLVRPDTLFGSGQLPKFEDQQFKLNDADYDLYMIPTAEVPLNGLHSDEILQEKDLPLKYVAFTPCFRREAGAAGKNERGLIRTHQFHKVEMFAFCTPEQSKKLFDEFVESASSILKGLELHYRTMLLVTGDMSFAASRTVDLEVWLPGQDRYYEVSSVSNCTDFQARRSRIRFRKEREKPEFVHTLNGSGLATSRLMVALLENNQNEDGSVSIPKALQPYLGGETLLKPQQ